MVTTASALRALTAGVPWPKASLAAHAPALGWSETLCPVEQAARPRATALDERLPRHWREPGQARPTSAPSVLDCSLQGARGPARALRAEPRRREQGWALGAAEASSAGAWPRAIVVGSSTPSPSTSRTHSLSRSQSSRPA